MLFLSIIVGIILIFCGILYVASMIVSTESKEIFKASSLEAGFNSLSKSSKSTFSLQFFLLMLIFLVFDLELLFLFSVLFSKKSILASLLIVFVFLTFLLEWKMNKLVWVVL